MMENPLLIDVLNQLKLRLRFIQVIEIDDKCLVIQLNTNEESLLTISIIDSIRPLYAVTYKLIPSDAKSLKQFEIRTSDVVFEGLLSVATSIKKPGCSLPESPNPKIMKAIKRKR